MLSTDALCRGLGPCVHQDFVLIYIEMLVGSASRGYRYAIALKNFLGI